MAKEFGYIAHLGLRMSCWAMGKAVEGGEGRGCTGILGQLIGCSDDEGARLLQSLQHPGRVVALAQRRGDITQLQRRARLLHLCRAQRTRRS